MEILVSSMILFKKYIALSVNLHIFLSCNSTDSLLKCNHIQKYVNKNN